MRERKREDWEARDRERRDRSVKGRERNSENKPKPRRRTEDRDNSRGGTPPRKKKNHRLESDSDEDSPREPRKPFDQECKRLVEKYARARRTHSK